jgi:hemolysin III
VRVQSLGEEISNSISHGIGLLGAIAALPILVVTAVLYKDVQAVTAASIFGSALVLMYLSSTMYHALPVGKAKKVFQILDHVAIYVLIAGTYTPFSLVVLRGAWGWTLFGVVWSLAIAGIVLKTTGVLKHGHWSTVLYVFMGWAALIAVKPLVTNLSFWGLVWLVIGGAFYSFGVYYYSKDSKKYYHFIWHLFVLAGSVCHFFAVLYYS